MKRALGRLWPASLAGRITLTMLAGLLAFHLGSLWLLELGVLGAAEEGREEQVAERLATAKRTIGSLPEEVRGTAAGALSSPDLDIAWHRAASAAASSASTWWRRCPWAAPWRWARPWPARSRPPAPARR